MRVICPSCTCLKNMSIHIGFRQFHCRGCSRVWGDADQGFGSWECRVCALGMSELWDRYSHILYWSIKVKITSLDSSHILPYPSHFSHTDQQWPSYKKLLIRDEESVLESNEIMGTLSHRESSVLGDHGHMARMIRSHYELMMSLLSQLECSWIDSECCESLFASGCEVHGLGSFCSDSSIVGDHICIFMRYV